MEYLSALKAPRLVWAFSSRIVFVIAGNIGKAFFGSNIWIVARGRRTERKAAPFDVSFCFVQCHYSSSFWVSLPIPTSVAWNGVESGSIVIAMLPSDRVCGRQLGTKRIVVLSTHRRKRKKE